MHFDVLRAATIDRMVRRLGMPQHKLGTQKSGEGALRRGPQHFKLAISLVALSSALLLPHATHAQSLEPARVPAVEQVTLQSGPTGDVAATNSTSELVHVIEVGDTLSSVAQRYNVTLTDLATYNQIVDHNHVVLGQKVRIPTTGATIVVPAVVEEALPGAEGYHVMRQGDALGAIARLYNLTLEELLALNEIENPNLVRMGTMLRVTDKVEAPTMVVAADEAEILYTVMPGETVAGIAQAYGITPQQIVHDNTLTDTNLRVGQQLRIHRAATSMQAFGVDAPAEGERKIVIDLSDQTLSAYQGDVRVLHTIVSTGKAATPTIPGEFAIYQKLTSQHMWGDDYDLPGVPWVMYYYDEYAIHGAYWHANFGTPTSHGCTNMTIPESKALFSWASIGTRVIVQP